MPIYWKFLGVNNCSKAHGALFNAYSVNQGCILGTSSPLLIIKTAADHKDRCYWGLGCPAPAVSRSSWFLITGDSQIFVNSGIFMVDSGPYEDFAAFQVKIPGFLPPMGVDLHLFKYLQ